MMHSRLAPYCVGSGQFRTDCGLVVDVAATALDSRLVDCPECKRRLAKRALWLKGEARLLAQSLAKRL